MRPVRDAIVLSLLLVSVAHADGLRAFAERRGLTSTLRTWWVDRLRSGGAAARMEAAKALGTEGPLFEADSGLSGAERAELLRQVVAALAPSDPSAARPRLEVARQELGLAASRVDALRGDASDATAAREALEALGRMEDTLRPLQARLSESGADRGPGSALREPVELLDAWRRTLQAWCWSHAPSHRRDARAVELELARAMVEFGRLVDVESDRPLPADASRDLMRTELGAEAALGLAAALHTGGRASDAAAWLEAIETSAPDSDAAARVPSWRLGFAIDAGEPVAMRAAFEAMARRGIAPSSALAAARAASRISGADAAAVVAAAVAAMDPSARGEWLEGLARAPGPLQDLALGLRAADASLARWQRGDREGADAAATQLARGLEASRGTAPEPIRAEGMRALGWALRASGSTSEASRAFEAAAGTSASLAPECLWLAALSEPALDAAGRARRADLLARQRTLDPRGPWAGRVAAWSSRLGMLGPDPLAVAVLLDVPESDAFLADVRAEAARRMLASSGTDAASMRAVAERALRALEPVAHAPEVAKWRLIAAVHASDRSVARQSAASLREADRADPAVIVALVRLHAMEGDAVAARGALARLSPRDAASAALSASFALASAPGSEAATAALDLALLALEAPERDPSIEAAALDRLARATLRAADESVVIPADVSRRACERLAVGEAGSRVQAFALAEALRMSGRSDEAIDRLQRVGNTLAQGGAPWTESRWRLHRALRAVDAARARRMLEQHLLLVPDGGAEPWGALLRQAAQEGTP